MTVTANAESATHRITDTSAASRRFGRLVLTAIFGLWLAIFFASLFACPVMDDADGTHANAARQMLLSGDSVTLRVNNVRYLEKAPLPYWIAAGSIRLFGIDAFAIHLPQAIAVLLLTLLGWRWSRQAFSDRAALYTALAVLTSAGVFLFTRVFIPDVLLSLLLAVCLYCFLRALEESPGAPFMAQHHRVMSGMKNIYPYAMWTALALAVLTKGLVALVFFFGSAAIYLSITGEARHWRRLRPFSGALLFLAIAAPWHVLAGLRNTGGMNGHGFFWFYFINEHVLRFLGRRVPMDYNKLPGYLYWTLHIAWLFPWSLFLPLAFVAAWRCRAKYALTHLRSAAMNFASRTVLLAAIYSALVLIFFSLSTNQEYYTFPAYLPLLMLLAASLARAEEAAATSDALQLEQTSARRSLTFAHAAFTALGLLIATALAWGLWISRNIPAAANVGDLLAHRGVGSYTLSMSSLFDLTGPSFAALRLPAALALATFALGPAIAWAFRARKLRAPFHSDSHLAATTTVALTSAVFLIAASIALARFAPMLSSLDFAQTIQRLESTGQISPSSTLLLFGDQAYGSSIPFYLDRPLSQPALLVDGRSSSMLFGSTFPDAQSLFLTPAQLSAQWGTGPRKLLFVPLERRDDVDQLLGRRQIVLAETAGKALLTDLPLNSPLDSAPASSLHSPQTKGPSPAP